MNKTYNHPAIHQSSSVFAALMTGIITAVSITGITFSAHADTILQSYDMTCDTNCAKLSAAQ